MKRTVKWALLAGLLLCVLTFTGCLLSPDATGNNNAGTGYTGDTPFRTYGATSTPVPQNTQITVITPTPDPAGGTQSWQVSGVITPTPTIGVMTPPPTATPTVSPTPTAAGSALRLGSQGDEVRAVQRLLKGLGYYSGSVDGDFGEGTEKAVIAFQKQNRISADGVVGAQTLAKLSAASAATAAPSRTNTPTVRATATPKVSQNLYLRYGDTGSDVRTMQNRLIALGYLSGEASGTFDRVTEKAVTAFQKRNVSYSDGVAGPMTLTALYSANAKGTSTSQGVIGVKLEQGSEGTEVKRVQQRLKELGYYSGSVDGDYGSGTIAAVKAFQNANNLDDDGKAGPMTLDKLYSDDAISARQAARTNTPRPRVTDTPKPTSIPVSQYYTVTAAPSGDYVTLRMGTKGALVERMQQALKDQGYYRGDVDGYYGLGTYDAVVAFQKDKGLSQDGAAGPATLRYLYEGDFPYGA